MTGVSVTEASVAHGMNYLTLDNWVRLEKLVPVGHRRPLAGFGRQERLFDPAEIAALVGKRTPPAGWLDLKAAAVRMGVSEKWAYRLSLDGRIKSGRWNGRLYVDPADCTGSVPKPGPRFGRVCKSNQRVKTEAEKAGGEPPEPAPLAEVPFGPSGLTLYQSDLDHLAKVQAARLARAGREGV